MIDPTEMVRRNWMFGLLQQALTHGLRVSVVNSNDAFVQGVTLQPRFADESTTDTAKGMVLELSLLPTKGTVTIRVPNSKFEIRDRKTSLVEPSSDEARRLGQNLLLRQADRQ
jgi:hypothetical protein